MAKKHFEFKPDPTGTSVINKLYLTQKQRMSLLKWLLYGLILVIMIVLQDVLLSKYRVLGAAADLVSMVILMVCILQGPERGGVFALVGALFYWFSGSSSGAFCVIFLTFYGVGAAIFRYAYLRKSFGTVFCCTAVSLMLYEFSVFLTGMFLNQTVMSRWSGFLTTALMSLAGAPVLYPILKFVGKIGGETWKD